MAVRIVNRLYNEIFTDGQTDWLLGNVGDWQKLTISAETAIDYFAQTSSPVEIDYLNNTFTIINGQTWGDFGFDNGMLVVFKYKISQDTNDDGEFDTIQNFQDQYNITNIYGNVMQVAQQINAGGFDIVPSNFGAKKITDVKFYVDKAPEGCRLKYSHITNDEFQTKNLTSFIDGSITEFALPNIGSGGLMEAIGIQSGMSIRGVDVISNGKKVGTDNVYQYDIEIQYMISSLFEDTATFETMEQPSFLVGDGSLTDNFILEFYPEWNNPNVIIQNQLEQTERLGNTGWFQENFNQLPNDFKIDSIEYFDINANLVDSLDFASTTKVKAVISGVPNLNALTECGFGFAWIPSNEEDYKNKLTPYYRNVFVSNGDYEDGFSLDVLNPGPYYGAGLEGGAMDVSNMKFTKLNDQIIFEGNFTPNASFLNIFDAKDEDDRNYILWFSVADGDLERNFSDRVSLLADFNLLTKNIAPAGEYPYLDNKFIEHPFDEDATGVEKYKGLVQDGILSRIPFRINKDQSSVFQRMTFGVEAFNIGLNQSFDLDRYEIDLTDTKIDADGVQQLSFDQIRGFKLVSGNNKNWVKIAREASMDTTDFYGYLAYFATKIRWEDWILNENAPSVFFDASQLNNGLNNDWIGYLRALGWEINFFTEIVAIEDGELVQYKNQFEFEFADYDENDLIDTDHKYFRDSDDTLLNIGVDPDTGKPLGVVLSDEPTRIEIRFDILDAGTWDLPNTYGVMTIEVDKGAGRFEQRQLSSVWLSEDDNPLKPITGETKLKLEVDGTFKFLTMSAIIDPDLLTPSARYRVTGRVGCFDDSGDPFVPGLYEFRYEATYQ